jgi:phosphoribosylamine--glycine ligase/phosphoribosylformylglycinamidine cyclo-ligase
MNTIHFDGMHYRKDIAHRYPSHMPLNTPNSNPPSAFKQPPPKSEPLTYASAGVSITTGNDLVTLIKPLVRSTSRPGSDAVIGGFGGTFSLPAAGYSPSSPILIGAIDGVGTKLKVAYAMETHDTVGIDLVAMNANDLVVQGAEALFFLDCYSCSALDISVAASFIKGVAEGCRQANCALVGGETAEMPGLFAAGTSEYDAVGAAIGALPAGAQILPDVARMREGDILLGLASSGVHSNGFSLIRKIVEKQGMTYQDYAPWEQDKHVTVGASLLTPTRIYVKSLLSVIRKHNTDPQSSIVKGLSHITGGGLLENVPRMLPKHLRAEIDVESWEMPAVFRWMKKAGNVAKEEMGRTFNCGVGMVVVVGVEKVEEVTKELVGQGERVFRIGRLAELDEEGGEQCVLSNIESWDRD